VECRKGFQSLLSWMLPLNSSAQKSSSTSSAVSILVILDVALELQVWDADYDRVLKFQSLLSWMLPLNAMRFFSLGRNIVSILVILDVALELCFDATPKTIRMFQSLLSWMLPLNIPRVGLWFRSAIVSILVILDVALELMVRLRRVQIRRSFNPCYPGCCP